ncbi:MAG: 6-bladed beta-propeller [Gemmatimonadota bacterium]|nr:6-bladed beta-propeller [Gemmatimonadota bacterium]MDE2872445.1 6-bladed beta-propeller [Gemmatimonadota bacterium]
MTRIGTVMLCGSLASGLSACASDLGDDDLELTPVEEWTAEPEYEFGDQMEGDALFGQIRDVRPAADGSRIYVLDAQSVEVTIWTPDGTLTRRVGGRGEGPGEFSRPGTLFLFDDRFQVGDNGLYRYTTFTLDGEVVGTEGFPSGVGPVEPGMDIATLQRVFTQFQVFAMFDDGSVGALGMPPWTMAGEMPEEEAPAVAVLRASQEGGDWGLDTLGLLSFRDVFTLLPHPKYGDIRIPQPWIPPDHFQMDPWNGSVVISSSLRAQPGVLQLIEVSTADDTLWTRRVRLPPIPVTEDDIEAAVDERAPFLGADPEDSTAPLLLKRAIRNAFIIPDHWPATREIRLMSNGEIWFRPAGHANPGMWHAARKGDDEGPIRSVVLPERFGPMDVTATHVWGVRRDELEVQYVVGLRLERVGG